MKQEDALGDVANLRERKVRPLRLKPHLNQASYRSGEALRHPKSRAIPPKIKCSTDFSQGLLGMRFS